MRKLVAISAAILAAAMFVVAAGAFILPLPKLALAGDVIGAWVGAGILFSGIALWFWRRS